jgi:hypothetical protein
MQKTGKTLTAHEGTMGVMKETAESNRAALQQQVSANLDETRAIPATIPPLEQFNNWVKKVRQRFFFSHSCIKMYHFTKTGSGHKHVWGNSESEWRVSCRTRRCRRSR